MIHELWWYVIIIIHLQNLGKICVTCQVNQFVNDANKDDLEGMESSLEKALLLLVVIVVLKHVVVVGVVVVVHRAVGVDQEEGGGRRGGEGDRGRSDWCENEGYVGADVVLGVFLCWINIVDGVDDVGDDNNLDEGALKNGDEGVLELPSSGVEVDFELFPRQGLLSSGVAADFTR